MARKWSSENKEAKKASDARRRISVKYKEYQKQWRAEHRENNRLYAILYRDINPEKYKESINRWKRRNPKYWVRLNQNRRTKELSRGRLSRGIETKLYKLQRGLCACCRRPLGDDYHLDHILPIALGGTNTDDNVQLLRKECNLQKRSKHPIDFMQSRGFLL